MRSRSVRLVALGAIGAVMFGSSACSTAQASNPSPACGDGSVHVDVTWQPQAESGSTRMGLIGLTNISQRECRLQGRAAVTLTNAADEDVDVPTENVEQPGPSTGFMLPPGSTAFQGIKWTVCDKGDASCGVGNGLRVVLPGQTAAVNAELSGFPAPESSDITMSTLQVGTIQASHQGVVAW